MTYPDFSSGEVLTSSDMDRVGLWRIFSTTSSATASATIVVSNVFSSSFENYKILVSGGSTNVAVDIALTLGSSATGYYGGVMYHPFTTAGPANVVAVGQNNATSYLYAGNGHPNGCAANIDLYGPNLAKITGITTQFPVMNINGSVVNSNGIHAVAASYTGFTLTAVTGTFTSVRVVVYGYNNN